MIAILVAYFCAVASAAYHLKLSGMDTYIQPKKISPLGEVVAEVVALPPPIPLTINEHEVSAWMGQYRLYAEISKPTSQVPFPVIQFIHGRAENPRFAVKDGKLVASGEGKGRFYSCDPADHTGYRHAVIAFYESDPDHRCIEVQVDAFDYMY